MNRSSAGESNNNLPQRRAHSTTTTDDHLIIMDLFSRNRRIPNSDDSGVSVKLGRISVGSAKQPKGGFDDLLSSVDGGGKNDYDWLLTPPGTPLFPPSDGSESQITSVAPRSSSSVRSASSTMASRVGLGLFFPFMGGRRYHSSFSARERDISESSSSHSYDGGPYGNIKFPCRKYNSVIYHICIVLVTWTGAIIVLGGFALLIWRVYLPVPAHEIAGSETLAVRD